nr:type IV pilin [Methanoculleus sp. FWC-SCC3]
MRRAARGEAAISNTHAVLLMVAITIILAALVLLMVLGMFSASSWIEPAQPPIIVTEVSHVNAGAGALTYASRITLLNNGSTTYENDDLSAVIYVNGYRACIIQTLNGHLLIPSHHYGVKTLSGEGCRDRFWNPGEEMTADLTDGTFYPGVEVTLEVVDKRTERVISKHTVRA